MSLAVVYSRALSGIEAPLVEVETYLANGLPSFNIVGLPETEVKESRDRVRAAIIQSGFDFPTKKIIVNLAPAELPKESGRFDLPIAISILVASGQIKNPNLKQYEFAGELSLSGLLRPIKGALVMIRQCQNEGRSFILPKENGVLSSFIHGATVYIASTLKEVSLHLNELEILTPYQEKYSESVNPLNHPYDLSDIKGQQTAKFALEIAASGNHNILFIGPPGTGKSMLAHRLPSILPALNHTELLDNAMLLSLSNSLNDTHQLSIRPFRTPHHSSSAIALIGGGADPKPGEVSLANHGVLFLDELPEFNRQTLEMLREPLETGEIHISRALRQVTFPAKFQLIAAMNPCPCGYHGHPTQSCSCTPERIKRYTNKISGPFLDRMDLITEVPSIPTKYFLTNKSTEEENSDTVKERVIKARNIQINRQNKLNNELSPKEIDQVAKVSEESKELLIKNMEKLNLSARGFYRILKVARTIADLDNSHMVKQHHLLKAISFRRISLTP